jgi:hypothetical protein
MNRAAEPYVLSAGKYLVGVLALSAIVAPLAWGAWRVRGRLLPGWRGAPARVTELVLALSGLLLLAEVLGTIGIFGEGEMIAGAIAAGLVAGFLAGPEPAERGPVPPAPAAGTIAKGLALVGCAAVAAGWMVPTLGSLAAGMDRADTLWYHMPLAARFAQTGSLGDIFYFDPIFFASFYPANSEVVHATGIITFDRDILSPLVNMGWLAVGLGSAWCIGRPYGLGPQALLGGGIALGAQMLVEFQAGEALNDITGVALVLVSVALLVNGHAAALAQPERAGGLSVQRGALIVAGLAAGLAAGTKLSFLAPVVALTIGVIVIAPSGLRRLTAALWTLPLVATSAYWYLRNLFATGNPIPIIHSIGPINLPAPERTLEIRPGLSVAHYWNDPTVWKDWFVPGLHESFGDLWPVTLLAMAAAAVYAVWRGRDPLMRMLGAVVLFTAVAYVFTPLTAAGEDGQPIGFVWNVRYIAPAAAVGLAILPCLPGLRDSSRTRTIVTATLAVLLAATVASLVQWHQGHVKGAVAAALAVLVGGGAIWFLRSRGFLGPAGRRVWKVGLVAVAAVFVLGAGYAEQRHYLKHRYENTSPAQRLADALRWARNKHDRSIAIGGIRGVFNQYPFYGVDLSNHVQWLGIKGPHDAWLRIPNCPQWRAAVNAGHYDYVVTTYDPFNPGRLTTTREGIWTRRDPAAKQVLRDGPVAIFRIEGRLDPATCDGLPALSHAELNGESLNQRPLANQPPGSGPRHRDSQGE